MVGVGYVPISPPRVVGPVLVIPAPARTAKGSAVPSPTAVASRAGSAGRQDENADGEDGNRCNTRELKEPRASCCGGCCHVLFIFDPLKKGTHATKVSPYVRAGSGAGRIDERPRKSGHSGYTMCVYVVYIGRLRTVNQPCGSVNA